MWQTVLSLYYDPEDASLPTFEEVLICTKETTIEEVNLYIKLWIYSILVIWFDSAYA